MEQLIIFAILAILGSLFSGKDKKKAPRQGQPKPFTAGQDSPVKKLKEMSKEMVQEMQKELQKGADEPPSRQTPPIAAPRKPATAELITVNEGPVEVQKKQERPSTDRHRGRLSAHGGTRKVSVEVDKDDLVPKTSEDFLKGIVFSEILAPPKSKR
jgi:hypothetical protein